MGKHDNNAHILHTPKKDKFQQPKPPAELQSHKAPQAPKPGHSAYNLFK